jgi:thiamine-phosphate pyrophosphorylase
LRAKQAPDNALLELASALARAAAEAGAALIVNDRADIALLAGAAGVHVGQDDLPVADVRRVVGEAMVVGVSTHTPEQIDAALATDAGYVAVGPVYGTATKDTGYDARGLDLVGRAAGRGKPVVAIGGITLERAPAVLAAGAWAVAVITDLLADDDVEARVRAYTAALPPRSLKV